MAITLQTASLWKRGTGFLGDAIILSITNGILALILYSIFPSNNLIYTTIGVILQLSYLIIFTYKLDGTTIGKKTVKTKVISLKGKLMFWQVFIREVILYIFVGVPGLLEGINVSDTVIVTTFCAWFLFGLVIVTNKQHRGIHDFIAGTRVIKAS